MRQHGGEKRLSLGTLEYKLVLDTIRIACANAESELASLLAPNLPRAAEAKKTLANLVAAPGNVRVGNRSMDVCLSPAGTRPEQAFFGGLLDAVNRLKLSMPGDQQARPIRFRTARTGTEGSARTLVPAFTFRP